MKRLLARYTLLFGFLLSLCLVFFACQNNTRGDTLIIGMSADYPPFEFREQGELKGFDVDFAKALAAEMGKTLTIEEMAYSSLIPALKSGRVHMLISSMSITPERRKSVDFSDIYYYNAIVALVPHNSSIRQLADLENKNIGAQLGSTMEQFAKRIANRAPNTQLEALENNLALVQNLKIGRLDAVLLESAQAYAFAAKDKTLQPIFLHSGDDGYAVALPKNSPDTKEVNRAIRVFENNGFFDTLAERWVHVGK